MNYFNNITLQKSMYNISNKSFTDVLESLDPSSNYVGTPFANLDPFQRQLSRFDIKVSGSNSDNVSKFFESSETSCLFPEYVSRAVFQGMKDANILSNIISTTTKSDSTDYRSYSCFHPPADKELAIVSEGCLLPITEIKPQEKLVHIKKRGRILTSSYETIKHQKLDLFTISLKQIGAYISHTQLKDAINVLINGDGNLNPAHSISFSDDIKYDDLIRLWSLFEEFNMDTILVSPNIMSTIVTFPQFQNPLTGLNFNTSGNLTTPFGAKLFKTSAMPDNTIIGLDSKSCLEMVLASDLSLEYDKLIDCQIHRTSITTMTGFAKIFPDAVKVLSKTI